MFLRTSVAVLLLVAAPAWAAKGGPLFCGELLLGAHFSMSEVAPRIFHLSFRNQRELAATFLRMQEHYESPRFRGRVFSRTSYKNWYRAERGRFSYYEDWAGFNIPSHVLEPFYSGRFKRLTARERAVLKTFETREGPFYIIGTFASDHPSTLDHEIAHGLFHTNEAYRSEVLRALERVDLRPVREAIRGTGYHESVLTDEAHAYLLTDTGFLAEQGVDLERYAGVVAELKTIFARHLNRLGQPAP